MRVILQEELVDLDNTPIIKDDGTVWTVALAMEYALLTSPNGDAEYKSASYSLAEKIHAEAFDVDLSLAELLHCKKSACDVFKPLIYGQLANILEGKSNVPV